MAVALFLVGLAAIVLGIGGLAGIWWALLTLGVVLVALAVLTEVGGRGDKAPETKGAKP
ncbi:hypothetical protein [Cellulosimicrobium sp. NPDC057862]|uniref:hypothetical protein n=1 Tax=Actinomycetes TaxID=1760 RepID=UPI00366AC563